MSFTETAFPASDLKDVVFYKGKNSFNGKRQRARRQLNKQSRLNARQQTRQFRYLLDHDEADHKPVKADARCATAVANGELRPVRHLPKWSLLHRRPRRVSPDDKRLQDLLAPYVNFTLT